MPLTRRARLLLALWLIGTASIAHAQSTTGTIRGHVTDQQGLPLPGASVTVASTNLQGLRTTATSDHGDYLLTLLPPGAYDVTFEMNGFNTIRRTASIAPTQVLPLDVTFKAADVAVSVDVIGTATNVLSRTAQVATSYSQALIGALPLNRDITSALLLAPGVHQTGANGAFSIAGAPSFEGLFMVNGAPVTENLRGQPYDLYVEDAIQETTVASAGISAEYGRFTGGVVNVVTKSGGNIFSGSFRDTLQNDKWRGYAPSERKTVDADPLHKDIRVDKTVPTYEYTLGGPLVKDRLWFFTAGRAQRQEAARTLVVTGIPYVFSDNQKRYEGNATYSPKAGQRFQGVFVASTSDQVNQSQNPATAMDLNSLFNPQRDMNLSTLSYTGVISPRFFVEARVSVRNETLSEVGASTTDRIDGTLLIDRGNHRYWAPTFCAVCGPEQRDAQDVFLKGSYFLSTEGLGAHDVAFGFDSYNDSRVANNHQSGSDYRIIGTNVVQVGTGAASLLYPQFLNDGQTMITYQPILVTSLGSNFRTHSLFFNDNWRISSRLTANLGVRYDHNHGDNGVHDVVARDSAFSPRISAVLDPTGDQRWAISVGYAKYVAALANTIADVSSPGGNADAYTYAYLGPSINTDPSLPLVQTADAIKQVFDWFDNNGGLSRPLASPPTARGLTPQIPGSLKSPNAREFSSGVSRQLNQRASVRVDVVYRSYHDFYAQRTDLTTGTVLDLRPGIPPGVANKNYDLTVIENTDLLKRRYAGASFQGQYHPRTRTDVGASYTLSRLWGNADAETLNSGPIASDILQYPEYKQLSWNAPEGDLAADQRHRLRAWVNYGLPARLSDFSLGVLQVMESGSPYGAVGTINSAAYVTNPGYFVPPSASILTYYYTARDAFHTDGQRRTDAALNFAHRLKGSLELFGQLQVVNVFNHYQLCGCGASTVFANGGAVIASRLDQTIRTPVTNGATYAAFNPFTTVPQQGTSWDLGPAFGTAGSRLAFTTPRTIRLSFGIRF